MKNKIELVVQRDFAKSVRKGGGWAKKLSHRFIIGVPDLLVGQYPYMPFLAEMKDLGQVPENFRQKLDVTEKQRHELRTFNESYRAGVDRDTRGNASERYAAVLLVTWAWDKDRWLGMLPWDATHATPMMPKVIRGTGGHYPVVPLFELFGKLHKVKLL